jgi:hypothetical protein
MRLYMRLGVFILFLIFATLGFSQYATQWKEDKLLVLQACLISEEVVALKCDTVFIIGNSETPKSETLLINKKVFKEISRKEAKAKKSTDILEFTHLVVNPRTAYVHIKFPGKKKLIKMELWRQGNEAKPWEVVWKKVFKTKN